MWSPRGAWWLRLLSLLLAACVLGHPGMIIVLADPPRREDGVERRNLTLERGGRVFVLREVAQLTLLDKLLAGLPPHLLLLFLLAIPSRLEPPAPLRFLCKSHGVQALLPPGAARSPPALRPHDRELLAR